MRSLPVARLAALAAFAIASTAALAAPFQNGSFETTSLAGCNNFDIPAGSTAITGWTVTVGNVDLVGAGCSWTPSHGTRSLDLVGQGFGRGGVEQTFDTVPGRMYAVSFDLAGNFGGPPVIKPLAVTINGTTTNFTFDTSGRGLTNMGWTTHTITFTASSASSTLRFESDVSAFGGTLNAGAALDNVRVAPLGDVASEPIPLDWAHWAGMLLVMVAAAGLFSARRTMR